MDLLSTDQPLDQWISGYTPFASPANPVSLKVSTSLSNKWAMIRRADFWGWFKNANITTGCYARGLGHFATSQHLNAPPES
jgi:hypothetical protein